MGTVISLSPSADGMKLSWRVFSRFVPTVLLCAFVLTGCGEIRYDERIRTTSEPTAGVKYRVDQNDRATAKYILRHGNRALKPVGEYQVAEVSAAPGPPPMPASPLVLEASDVLFDFDKSVIRVEFYPELDEWVSFFKTYPEVQAEIHGHADSTGPAPYNQKLSERRAQAVINYLVDKGVDPARLTGIGFGEEAPAVPNDTRENRQKNRRVELHF